MEGDRGVKLCFFYPLLTIPVFLSYRAPRGFRALELKEEKHCGSKGSFSWNSRDPSRKKSRERLQGPASIGNISRHQGFKDPTLLPSLGWDLSPWHLSPQRGGGMRLLSYITGLAIKFWQHLPDWWVTLRTSQKNPQFVLAQENLRLTSANFHSWCKLYGDVPLWRVWFSTSLVGDSI